MATINNEEVLSFPVNTDLSSFQFCIVALTTAGYLTTAADTATVMQGVLENKPDGTVEQMGAVRVRGQGKIKANGTTDIAIGDSLTATTAGVAIKTTTDNAQIVAIALEGHTADSDAIIEAMITPTRRY